MRLFSKSPSRTFRGARILGLALPLLLPIAARADFASDIQVPARLLEADQFDKAAVALQKIAPRHQNQFGLHYLLGLAHMGRLSEKNKAADIKILQQSRQSFLRAQRLAKTVEQKREARDLLTTAEDGLRDLGALPEKTTAPPKTLPVGGFMVVHISYDFRRQRSVLDAVGVLSILPNNGYQWMDNPQTRGRYSYNASTGKIRWIGGIYGDGRTEGTAKMQGDKPMLKLKIKHQSGKTVTYNGVDMSSIQWSDAP